MRSRKRSQHPSSEHNSHILVGDTLPLTLYNTYLGSIIGELRLSISSQIGYLDLSPRILIHQVDWKPGISEIMKDIYTYRAFLYCSKSSLCAWNVPCPCSCVNRIGHPPKTRKRHSNDAQTCKAVHDARCVNNRQVDLLGK